MPKSLAGPTTPWRRPWWLAFLDRTNVIVISLTVCVVFYMRSAGVVYFATGATMCSITVKLLKRAIRQPRPAHPSHRKVTYGMPSTHSATITYFAVYIPLACRYLPLHHSLPAGSISRIIPPIIAIPWASLIAISRIWLGHHTWPQVVAGCSYGIVFAVIWFKLWTEGFDEYGRVVERAFESYLEGR